MLNLLLNAAKMAAMAPVKAAGKIIGGPPGGWGNFSFAVSNWDSLFSRWLPSSTRAVTIKVQGARGTPSKDVLHFALSLVFGVINNRDTKLVNFGLRVQIDHVNNAVVIGFAVTTIAAVEGIRAALTLLEEAQKSGFWDVKAGQNPKLLEGAVGLLESPIIGPIGWLIGNAAGFGPEMKIILGKGIAVISKAAAIISEKVGAGQVWNMGREEIRGGRAMVGIRSPRPQNPFDKMARPNVAGPDGNIAAGEVHLTRLPAANPQPPAALGDDVRTLVAQVLHDPGVRPPTPMTDIGPPTTDE